MSRRRASHFPVGFSALAIPAAARGLVLLDGSEDASPGRLVCIMLGPHERTPSWEGEDIFSVCDVLPFPKFLKDSR